MSRLLARPAHARGFTLLEMLISVSLLALIITLAYGSLRVAAQSSRSGEALIERTEELRTTQSFLRRQISQLLPMIYEYQEDTGQQRRFDGQTDRLTFVAPMPGYLSRGGAHVQQLELVDGRGGLQLQFRFAQLNGFDAGKGFPESPEPVVLVDGIRSGRFQYRQMQADGVLGDWVEQWDETLALPILVRLDLEFDEGDLRQWPEFVVATRGGMSQNTLTFDSLRPAPPVGPVRPREAP